MTSRGPGAGWIRRDRSCVVLFTAVAVIANEPLPHDNAAHSGVPV